MAFEQNAFLPMTSLLGKGDAASLRSGTTDVAVPRCRRSTSTRDAVDRLVPQR